MYKIFILLIAFNSFYSCKTIPKGTGANPPSPNLYTQLLQKHVDDSGWVNYKGLINDRNKLEEYLQLLSNNPPGEQWSRNEQIAYWINAYNAFTLKLIIDHYPLNSIKDIGSSIQIPFVNTPWQKKFFSIGGNKMDLDEIEHNILRKRFNEPRIHFALVCASRSCAKLRREAYTGSKLDEQLNEQTRAFMANKNKNKITADNAAISSYFKWFKKDFTKNNGTVREYINKYAPVKINENASITYLEYDWSLNEQL